jgi:DNA-binding XRE family transcriptional regulator
MINDCKMCNDCPNLAEGECRVFVGKPIPNADGSPCRAKGWVWDEKPPRPRHPRGTKLLFAPNRERLRELRTAAGLSQNKLCTLAHICTKGYGRIEDGRQPHIRWQTAEAIARVLGVEPERLVAG